MDRGRYGRLLWLCGDSIMGGYALGVALPPSDHPLRAYNSPRGMLNEILAMSGVRDIAATDGVQVIGSPPFAPDAELAVYPERVVDLIARRLVRGGDVLVFEDAGPHGSDPRWYAAALMSILAPVVARRTVTAALVTTPSYPPAPDGSRWDLPGPSRRSMNDVIRAASDARYGVDVVRVEWAAEMDVHREYMRGQWAIDPFHADGIHPNIWGQLLLCRLILEAALGWCRLTTTAPLRALLKATNRDPAYAASVSQGSPYCTDDCIDDLVSRLMGMET